MRALVIISIAFILSSCANTNPEPKNDLDSKLLGSWETHFASRTGNIDQKNIARYMNNEGVFNRLTFNGISAISDVGNLEINTKYKGAMRAEYTINEDTLTIGSSKESHRFVYYPSEFPVSLKWLHTDTLILHLAPID